MDSSPNDSDIDRTRTISFVHTVPAASRIVPSASQWNSIELDFNLVPRSENAYHSIPSNYSKSYTYELVISDKSYFRRFLCILGIVILVAVGLPLLLHFLPRGSGRRSVPLNVTLAVNRALTFFDAQKSGRYPSTSPVKFRGISGMEDGNSRSPPVDLKGGFYDSGSNLKFSFPTAYTITLLSWSVIEYNKKYDDIGELQHVKNIIKWGSDYLLKAFVRSNSTNGPITLYSQVGSTGNGTNPYTDLSCWQRPEDMSYPRPVFACDGSAADLAGEVVAALSAASMVFQEEKDYSHELVTAAVSLYGSATKNNAQNSYTNIKSCGGDASRVYNSSGFQDELVWAGTWLFFATGNTTYLEYAALNFSAAVKQQAPEEQGVFYWNNKVTATGVLLTRLRFFRDLGYPFEIGFKAASEMTEAMICSYLSDKKFHKSPATASFLTKLYSDYLELGLQSSVTCGSNGFSLETMRTFSTSQVSYILGDNPMKTSYMVGFGKKYPTHVHHRAASIPADGKQYSCSEGDQWKQKKEPNPNTVYGAMVAGPDKSDKFFDDRTKPWFTEPTIVSNAGLVAALIAIHDPPSGTLGSNDRNLGIDQDRIFSNVHLTPPAT
ncbi:Endoglucanase 25 [Linum perenne]